MNTAYIPGPLDADTQIESAITKSANFNGTTFDNGAGFAPDGVGMPVAAVVNVSALAGSGTFTGNIQESADNSSFTDAGVGVPLISGAQSVPAFISQRYMRLKLALSGAGTITLDAYVVPIA